MASWFCQGCQVHLIGKRIASSTGGTEATGFPLAKEQSWTPISHFAKN